MKIWIKAVKEEFLDLEIADGFFEDRIAWRGKIHVVDPTTWGMSLVADDDDFFSFLSTHRFAVHLV